MRVAAVTLVALALLPLAPSTVLAFHVDPASGAGIERTDWTGPDAASVTFRGVAVRPDGDVLVAGGTAPADDGPGRQVLLRIAPDGDVTTVIDRDGLPFTALAVRSDGTALVAAQRNMLLLMPPDATGPSDARDLWADAVARGTFDEPGTDLEFVALDVAWSSDGSRALVAGSSLLRYDTANDTGAGEGPLRVVHGGSGAFFNAVSWQPGGRFALVSGGVTTERDIVLGAIWRTNGVELRDGDAAAVYGVFSPTKALVNDIAHDERGTIAVAAGRDGAGATLLRFDPVQYVLARQRGDTGTRSYAQPMPTIKDVGSVTGLDWNDDARLLAVGREADTIMLSDGAVAVALTHGGPDLFAVDWLPGGREAIAVGERGTIVRITPPAGPYGAVLRPAANGFALPEQRVSVRGFAHPSDGMISDMRVRVAPDGNWTNGTFDPRANLWNATMLVDHLEDGDHAFEVELVDTRGNARRITHPFTFNNRSFEPEAPTGLRLSGIESGDQDTNGLFNLSWESSDTGVNFEVERRDEDGVGQVIQVGSARSATLSADRDGTYTLRVRAVNRFFEGPWSLPATIHVILDRDADGVPDKYDPNPLTPDAWGDSDRDGVLDPTELAQCSDPTNASSTPATDDDGDGWANGIECELGFDPTDAADRPGVVEPPGDGGDGETPPDEEHDGIPTAGGAWAALVLVAIAVLGRRFRPR